MSVLAEDRPLKAIDRAPKQLIIDGQLVDARSGATFGAINPATGQDLCSVARAGAEDVDLAVAAARAAFEGLWRDASPLVRQRLLLRLADLVSENIEELALLDSLNVGLPYVKSKAAVETARDALLAYAALARMVRGSTIENAVSRDMLTFTWKEPVGVVASITPWNSPVTTVIGKLGPAIASGCTVILKPAEQSPLSGLRLGELCLEAGIPAGVVNVLTGFGDAGAALSQHPGVDKVSFTGSIETGQEIIRASAVNMKRLTLELGGKSPDIVFADADLERAVPAAAMAAFTLTGQFCAAGSRLLVERSIYDQFVERVVAYAQELIVGDPLRPNTDLGPVVSVEQLEKVLGYVELGEGEGAKRCVGGSRLAGEEYGDGYFLEPTVFADVDNEMSIARHEIFGPVISAIPFDTLEQALELSNATRYGLASGVWTNDVRKANRVAARLDAGIVWVNTYGNYDKAVPFGGHKMSGIGVENGIEGLEQYLQTKSVWMDVH